MKQTFALFLLLIACCTTISLNGAQGINWQTNYEAAINEARSTSKPIILFFTGSDWCGWCNRLDDEVFNTAEFAKSSGGKYIFVKVDSPLYTALPEKLSKQNEQLKSHYQIRSFPTLVIIDPTKEKPLGTTGYRAGGPAQYAEHLDKLIGNYTNYIEKVQNLQEQKLGGDELKKLYQKSKELDFGNDTYHLIKLGIESDEKAYFLTERFRFLAEEGMIHSSEALAVKKQLSALDAQNEKHLQYEIAIIEFEASCAEMQKENYSPDLAISPLVHYINKFGAKDKENLWRLEMIISQVYLDKNHLAAALKHAQAAHLAAPATVQSEIASAVESIQSQIAPQNKS